MTIRVHVELLKVSELVHRVMLQVVCLDLFIFGGLWLVFVPVLGGDSGGLVRDEVGRVLISEGFLCVAIQSVRKVVHLATRTGSGLVNRQLATSHQSVQQHVLFW